MTDYSPSRLPEPRIAASVATSTNNHLQIDAVTKDFGPQAVLKGVNLSVARGGTTAIVGPSGSGKTTLLRLIAGFEHPGTGSISLNGNKVAGDGVWVPAHKRHVGYVAQDGALFPHLSVGENISFGLDSGKLAGGHRAVKVRVGELLEMVSLDPAMAKRRPHQLSGGQQQRVALARALAREPELILLDEPFSALDAGLRVATRRTVGKVLKDAGVTTILVTHDQIEATTMADRVVVMNAGRIEQEGRPEDLYERPSTLFVASFVGSPPINTFDGQAAGGVLSIAQARLPLAGNAGSVEGAVVLGLRPESLAVGGVAGTSQVPVRVIAAEPMGREVLYTAESAMGVIRFLEAGAEARHREGDNVPLGFAPGSALLFDKASGQRLEARIAA